MNRRELVTALAAQTGRETRDVDAVLRGFTELVTSTVSKGEPVAITGFVKFAKVERPARMGRNPSTGEAIQIKASKKVRVTPLKAFKDAVMSGGGARGSAKKSAAKATAKKSSASKATKKTTASKSTAKKATKKATAKKSTRR